MALHKFSSLDSYEVLNDISTTCVNFKVKTSPDTNNSNKTNDHVENVKGAKQFDRSRLPPTKTDCNAVSIPCGVVFNLLSEMCPPFTLKGC